MTWSIIASDEHTGRVAIAVATRFFAVGAVVPYIAAGVGAVASQAFINPHYGPRRLALAADGRSAAEIIDALPRDDAGRHNRQLHVMDSRNRLAAYTTDDSIDPLGHDVRE